MAFRQGLLVIIVAVIGAAGLSGCTSKVPEGMPMPELTFAHMAPFPVEVAAIDIENRYDVTANSADASSSFPTPPDIVLRRYAENRLQPVGSDGTLKFIIEDASVMHSLVQPVGKFTGWLGVDRKDLYEVSMRMRLYKLTDDGIERTNAVLNLKRSISIPQRYSVAEKDIEKFKFLEMLMQDVDRAVTTALKEKINLASPYARTVPLSGLSSPEGGREHNEYGE